MRSTLIAIVLTASFAGAPILALDEGAKSGTTATTDADQKIKCRKVEVTGSLLKKGKVCRTIAEWKQIQSNGNQTARAIMETGQTCAGGNCGNGN